MQLLKKIIFYCISLSFKFRYRKLHIGRGVKIYPSTSLVFLYCNNSGCIKIGNNSVIGTFNRSYRMGWWNPVRLSIVGPNAIIEIGENTFLNGVNICARKYIKIGSLCHFASGVQIVDYNGHEIYRYDRIDRDDASQVAIGNNVWIGLNAIILKGTEIGDNSVVAAGSVVKGIFPSFSLIAGNPAKLVKILDKTKFS